jgi:hypothetical protein
MGKLGSVIILISLIFTEVSQAGEFLLCSRPIKRPAFHGLRTLGNVQYSLLQGIARWNIYEEAAPLNLSGLDPYCVVVPLDTTEASWNDIVDPTGK